MAKQPAHRQNPPGPQLAAKNNMRPDKFDPETLDVALVLLVENAQTTHDCFLMGDEPEAKPLPKRWRLRAR
jgi:hypothetical protein